MNLSKQVIKHITNNQLCYYVNFFYEMPSCIVIKADVLNLGYIDTYFENKTCTFRIDKSKLEDWFMCTELKKQCLRYSKWTEIK